ncbi:Rmf/CrpP fold protein [Streptomyces sp. MS191]|uniref:Rmf/CrpP fold protein n=1 Tax=Streptomyces sp. ms191 TaxID=1827978 RepID=UPI002905D1B0|nr:Rmf/CrpP fold protein [Streptomyces sp. ms191]
MRSRSPASVPPPGTRPARAVTTSRTDSDQEAPMGPREQLVTALNEGAEAGRRGKQPTACPYGAGDLRRSAWLRGYAKNRRLPGE